MSPDGRHAPGYTSSVGTEDPTRRVVFLDIDGVLAPIRRWDRYGDLERACIEVLNEIVSSARADVVVSSTWRHGRTVAELQAMLEAEGFTLAPDAFSALQLDEDRWGTGWLAWRVYVRGAVPDDDALHRDFRRVLKAYDSVEV